MKPTPIDPNAIKAGVKQKAAAAPSVKFSSVMSNAKMGAGDYILPFADGMNEFAAQSTGGHEGVLAVMHAAFSGISAAGAVSQGGGGMSYANYSPYSSSPGVMGSAKYGTTFPGASVAGKMGAGAFSKSGGVADTGMESAELMNTMNSNNLELLELQALMQSNMQSWTTKANILSADHRARMAMMEKLSTR